MTLIEMHLNLITCRTIEYTFFNLDWKEGAILPSNSLNARVETAIKGDNIL